MRLDDLREELHAIAADVPPSGHDARDVMRPAVRRRRMRGAVAAAVALVVVTGAVVAIGRAQRDHRAVSIGSRPGTSTPGASGSALSAATIANGRWSTIAPFPLRARSHAAVVWTGAQLVVWGGDDGQRVFGDGAAYDPDANTWRVLPPAPIAARTMMTSVWTGRELIVWGGDRAYVGNYANDGAAFDPVTWQWRTIAPSPLGPRYAAHGVWIGNELVVLGGATSNTGDVPSALDAAAYDPVANRWRSVTALPPVDGATIQDLRLVSTGREILVWEQWTRVTGTLRSFGLQLVEYDPATNAWRPGPPTDDPHRNVSSPAWTGDRVVVPATPPLCDLPDGAENCGPPPTNLHGSELDPATGVWTALPHGPADDSAIASVWTGDDLVVMSGGSVNPVSGRTIEKSGTTAAWNAVTDTWTTLPPASGVLTVDTMIWTGREIILWDAGRGLRYGLGS